MRLAAIVEAKETAERFLRTIEALDALKGKLDELIGEQP